MKTQNVISASILAALIILGIVAVCLAAPFLVCDPQSGVISYQFTGDAFFTTKVAESNGSLRYDLVGLPNGAHNINVTACNDLWGCSLATPYSFTKGVPTAPGNIHIIAQ
jgi:hypothetical protein